jgi:processive 1,2-diacylglycerol beta-glucosyltransferase
VKKVLILTAGFGDGHNTAARNVADAIEFVSDDVKVEVLGCLPEQPGHCQRHPQKDLSRPGPLTRPASGAAFIRCWTIPPRWKQTPGLRQIEDGPGSDILTAAQPDCVVSTYPVYGHVIQDIYRDHSERPFRFITVVTDSISVNSSWYRAPQRLVCVPNEATAEVLRKHGVDE